MIKNFEWEVCHRYLHMCVVRHLERRKGIATVTKGSGLANRHTVIDSVSFVCQKNCYTYTHTHLFHAAEWWCGYIQSCFCDYMSMCVSTWVVRRAPWCVCVCVWPGVFIDTWTETQHAEMWKTPVFSSGCACVCVSLYTDVCLFECVWVLFALFHLHFSPVYSAQPLIA